MAYALDDYVLPWTFFTVLFKRVKQVRAAIAKHGLDPDFVAETLDTYTREMSKTGGSSYDTESTYSQAYKGNRRTGTRTQVIDLAIHIATFEGSDITDLRLFEALLAQHDAIYPSGTNGVFGDERPGGVRPPEVVDIRVHIELATTEKCWRRRPDLNRG